MEEKLSSGLICSQITYVWFLFRVSPQVLVIVHLLCASIGSYNPPDIREKKRNSLVNKFPPRRFLSSFCLEVVPKHKVLVRLAPEALETLLETGKRKAKTYGVIEFSWE